jgi:hypothetical protein
MVGKGFALASGVDAFVESPHLHSDGLVSVLGYLYTLANEAQTFLLVGLVDCTGLVFLTAIVCTDSSAWKVAANTRYSMAYVGSSRIHP